MNKIVLLSIIFIELFYVSRISADIGRLMLTVEQRNLINASRNLENPVPIGKVPIIVAPKLAAKRYPKNISVSSIIVSPKGNKIVRVNGKFRENYLKNIKIDSKETTATKAKFIIDGKQVHVPVGKTYLTKTQKLTSNHAQEEKINNIKLKLATEKEKKQKYNSENTQKLQDLIKSLIGGG